MTTNNTIFKDKEHYLAFRAAWAKCINTGGEPTAMHHMMYNLLRGKAFDKGFSPITRENKLRNGFTFNHAVVRIANQLRANIKYEMASYIKLFDGTVTEEMMAQVVVPNPISMTPDFGPYGSVAAYVISHEDKPSTFEDLQKIYDMVTAKEAA